MTLEEAKQLLANPQTGPQDLYKVCAAHLELHLEALNHPAMYPQLRQWLAQYSKDEKVRAAASGNSAPAKTVQEPKAEEPKAEEPKEQAEPVQVSQPEISQKDIETQSVPKMDPVVAQPAQPAQADQVQSAPVQTPVTQPEQPQTAVAQTYDPNAYAQQAGAQNYDYSAYYAQQGQAVPGAQPNYAAYGAQVGQIQPKKPLNKKLLFGIGGGVVALVVILVVVLMLTGGSADTASYNQLNFTKDTKLKELKYSGTDIVAEDLANGYISDGKKLYKLEGDEFKAVDGINLEGEQDPDKKGELTIKDGLIIRRDLSVVNIETKKDITIPGIEKKDYQLIEIIDSNKIFVSAEKELAMFDASGKKLWSVKNTGVAGNYNNTYISGGDRNGMKLYKISDGSEVTPKVKTPILTSDGYYGEGSSGKYEFYKNDGTKVGEVEKFKNAIREYKEEAPRLSTETIYNAFKQMAEKSKADAGGDYFAFIYPDGSTTIVKVDESAKKVWYNGKEIKSCIAGALSNGSTYYCTSSNKTKFYSFDKTDELFNLDFSIEHMVYNNSGRWLVEKRNKIYEVQGV